MPPKDKYQSTGTKYLGTWVGFGFGLIAIYIIYWAGSSFGGNSVWLNHMFSLTGGLLGWIAGILISPLDKHERMQFSQFGAAITAFVSGFAVAKFERIFDLTITKPGDITEIVVGRSLLFVSTFALGMLFTFIWRRYAPG